MSRRRNVADDPRDGDRQLHRLLKALEPLVPIGNRPTSNLLFAYIHSVKDLARLGIRDAISHDQPVRFDANFFRFRIEVT